MSLITTLRLRRRSWGPVVLGMVVLGLMNVALQPCVQAAIIAADTSPARTDHDGHAADPAEQAAGEPQTPCSHCGGVDGGPHCDGLAGEDCATADKSPANSPIKPKDRSSDLTISSTPSEAATDSFSRPPAALKPVSALPTLPRLSLNIRYCVYLK